MRREQAPAMTGGEIRAIRESPLRLRRDVSIPIYGNFKRTVILRSVATKNLLFLEGILRFAQNDRMIEYIEKFPVTSDGEFFYVYLT